MIMREGIVCVVQELQSIKLINSTITNESITITIRLTITTTKLAITTSQHSIKLTTTTT